MISIQINVYGTQLPAGCFSHKNLQRSISPECAEHHSWWKCVGRNENHPALLRANINVTNAVSTQDWYSKRDMMVFVFLDFHVWTVDVFCPRQTSPECIYWKISLWHKHHIWKGLTPTWFEHATFWSGVRRATVAPRGPACIPRGKSDYFLHQCATVAMHSYLFMHLYAPV